MKGKRPYLWVLAAVGLVLWAVPLALYAKGVFLPTVLWVPLYGVGLVLFLGSLGTLFWRACLESDPVLRQHDHAVHDERNTAIRGKSQRQNAGDPAGGAHGRRGLGSCGGLVPSALGVAVRDFAAPQRGGVRCTLYYRRKM